MNRRSSRLAAWAVAVLSVLAAGGTAVQPAAAANDKAGTQSGSATCPGPAGLGTSIPVLLVHGFRDGPGTWSTMSTAITSALGKRVKVVPPFDYEQENTSWVTNPKIGPALAAQITDLAAASECQGGPGKVIIVAHSMGGLAVRCALAPGCAGKAANPDQVGLLITLGTPNLGSPLAGTAPQKVHYKGTGGWISTMMASLCDGASWCRESLLVGPATEAGRAMELGSADLRNLPALPTTVPVLAIAGKITVTDTMFGAPVGNWDIGDGVVLENSALAEAPMNPRSGPHSGPGSGMQTIPCGTVQLSELDLWNPGATPQLKELSVTCVHWTETSSPIWQAHVIAAIRAAADSLQSPPTAYVANNGDGTVTPIDLATGKPGTPISVGGGPGTIAITPDGETAYVSTTDTAVRPINLATGTPGPPIPVGKNVVDIAITPDGKTAYAVLSLGNAVTPINLATNTPGRPIPVGSCPSAVAITPDGRTAYVTSWDDGCTFAGNDGTVTPISLPSGTPGTPIPVGPDPGAIAITPDGKTAYVVNGDQTITPIALATGTPGTPIAVDAGAIAITPDGKTAYVVTLDNNTLTPIDLATATLGTPITVGSGQDAIAISPDGKTAYIASMEKNTVTPVNLTTSSIGTPIPVGTGPVAITIIGNP